MTLHDEISDALIRLKNTSFVEVVLFPTPATPKTLAGASGWPPNLGPIWSVKARRFGGEDMICTDKTLPVGVLYLHYFNQRLKCPVGLVDRHRIMGRGPTMDDLAASVESGNLLRDEIDYREIVALLRLATSNHGLLEIERIAAKAVGDPA